MRTVALSDVCSVITDGTHYTPPDLGSGVPFLTVKDVTPNGLDFDRCARISEDEYTAADAGNSAPKLGDVLFSKDGTVGKVHVVETDKRFAVLSSIAILRPSSAVSSRFLGHMLSTREVLAQAAKRKSGSAVRRIILSDLKQVQVPLPPLPEQRRIAVILDHADALRAKRRQVLAHLDALTQSIFHDMFGNELWAATLGELADVQIGPFGSLLHQSDYVSGGVVVINPMHIRGGTLQPDPEFSVTERKASTLELYRLQSGDVVLGRRGEMARAGVAGAEHAGMLCGTGSIILRPRGVDSRFLHAVVTSPRMKEHLDRRALGATLPNLNAAIVKGSPSPRAIGEAQAMFSAAIGRVDQARADATAACAADDELFASLQYSAFRGEL